MFLSRCQEANLAYRRLVWGGTLLILLPGCNATENNFIGENRDANHIVKTDSGKPDLADPLFTDLTPQKVDQLSPGDAAPNAKFSDPAEDLFDKNSQPVTGEPYLDIVESELIFYQGKYTARIKLNGPPPKVPDSSSTFIEWDLFIDKDSDPSTGGSWPLIFNDIGAEYLLRVELLKEIGYVAGCFDIEAQLEHPLGQPIINGNVIEFSFPATVINKPEKLNYVMAIRQSGDDDVTKPQWLADKAPNQGHYQFLAGKQEPTPSNLPSATLEMTHATVFYNPGNETKAKWFGDAFELAYTVIGQKLNAYPKKKFTLYIYQTQNDLVQGLQEFGGFSPEATVPFQSGQYGAPRPIKYMMHLSQQFNWVAVVHEYTHAIIEEISGKVYSYIKWLDEGLANYLAYQAILSTDYQQDAIDEMKYFVELAKDALANNSLLNLKDISTDAQLDQVLGTDIKKTLLFYAEAYVVTAYLVEKYGFDKCTAILKTMYGGASLDAALQKVLGVSLAQLNEDYQPYLQQLAP